MRVLSFSVLFALSEVGKAESNNKGQFPGELESAMELFVPGLTTLVIDHAEFVRPVVSGNLRAEYAASPMGMLLEGAVILDDPVDYHIPHGAKAACDAIGMQLPAPESYYDVDVLADYMNQHLTSRGKLNIYLGLARIVDDGNAPFYNMYTNELSEIDTTNQHADGERCMGMTNGKMVFDWFCNSRDYSADQLGWLKQMGVVCVHADPDTTTTITTTSTTTTTTESRVSCLNEHWTYNDDTEQCEPDADLSRIECGSTHMTISIHKAFVYEEYDGDVPSTITIGNKDCTSTWDADKMAVFKVNFNDECGQDIYHEDGTISISIDVDRSSSKEVDGIRIFTSKEDNMIWTFTCSYDDVISTKDSLEVSVSTLIGATTLHTAFPADAFPMKLVNVDAPSYPIKTGDMTRLTIQIPEGFPKILKLHFMTCTATAHNDESITINTVKDGCALDVIDSADASTSENAISYTYTAFAFSESELLRIRCDAKICLNSEVREECMEMDDTCAEGYTDIF